MALFPLRVEMFREVVTLEEIEREEMERKQIVKCAKLILHENVVQSLLERPVSRRREIVDLRKFRLKLISISGYLTMSFQFQPYFTIDPNVVYSKHLLQRKCIDFLNISRQLDYRLSIQEGENVLKYMLNIYKEICSLREKERNIRQQRQRYN